MKKPETQSNERILARKLARELDPLEMDLITGACGTGWSVCGASDNYSCDLDTYEDYSPQGCSGGW